MTHDRKAQALVGYALLVAFANDDHLDADELKMIERIALEDDGKISEEEKKVLRNIFARAERTGIDAEMAAEIARFRAAYDI